MAGFAGLAALAALLTACSSPPPAPPVAQGTTTHRRLPPAVAEAPLYNQRGQRVDLDSWKGKTVLLVPFLTLSTGTGPLATGNLLQLERMLRATDAASAVQIVELSVDPDRDSPARLAAYAQLNGADWQLVRASPATLRTVTSFFGFVYLKVPEPDPPSIDWWTHQPLTYDVAHSDGFVIIDPTGTERYVTDAAPDFLGRLPTELYDFLSAQGRHDLAHPAPTSWTPDDAMAALSWVMGRSLPTGR